MAGDREKTVEIVDIFPPIIIIIIIIMRHKSFDRGKSKNVGRRMDGLEELDGSDGFGPPSWTPPDSS